MSRPIIHCSACGRELFQLRRPLCIWCGAQISPDQFAEVAAPAQNSPFLSPPMPMPPLTGTPWLSGSRRLFVGNPFPLINKSVTPWEKKLRIAGAALFVLLMLARLAELFWSMWRLHEVIPGH